MICIVFASVEYHALSAGGHRLQTSATVVPSQAG